MTHKPATSLPWKAGVKHPTRIIGGGNVCASTADDGLDEAFPDQKQKEDAAYIVHACNNYKLLVLCVKMMADGDDEPMSMRKDRARELLRNIGEAE